MDIVVRLDDGPTAKVKGVTKVNLPSSLDVDPCSTSSCSSCNSSVSRTNGSESRNADASDLVMQRLYRASTGRQIRLTDDLVRNSDLCGDQVSPGTTNQQKHPSGSDEERAQKTEGHDDRQQSITAARRRVQWKRVQYR